MSNYLCNLLSANQMLALSSIVNVGDAAYRDLMENQSPMFGHDYFNDTRGRIRTKLVQMQCEIESKDKHFPFEFSQREFSYHQLIPELRTKNLILHIARSRSPETLPYSSKYKVQLSNNNHPIRRQMIFDFNENPPFGEEPYYGLLVFGGREDTFSVIQFPEPGYTGIADIIIVPQVITSTHSDENFERKKAKLKKEFLAHEAEKRELS